jgi:hypothetical protein
MRPMRDEANGEVGTRLAFSILRREPNTRTALAMGEVVQRFGCYHFPAILPNGNRVSFDLSRGAPPLCWTKLTFLDETQLLWTDPRLAGSVSAAKAYFLRSGETANRICSDELPQRPVFVAVNADPRDTNALLPVSWVA